jgi:NAD(P)-dependent dehydrogenase (short-subunit alcohol dehydrogenase family)
MNRLVNKFALITGGSSGIGLATAKLFAAEGARVAITGRDAKALEAVRAEIGGDTLAIKSDTADLAAIDALMTTVKDSFGTLDVLFVNAGISEAVPIHQVTERHFDRIFDVNVKGAFFTVQKALPLLRSGASIILNASVGYRMGRANLAIYAASKAAVRTLARNFSTEFIPRGIRVNVVSPGAIETPIWDRAAADKEKARAFKQGVAAAIPFGRIGQAEEVAAAVVFLASDESSFMAGTEITIDGGASEMPGAVGGR